MVFNKKYLIVFLFILFIIFSLNTSPAKAATDFNIPNTPSCTDLSTGSTENPEGLNVLVYYFDNNGNLIRDINSSYSSAVLNMDTSSTLTNSTYPVYKGSLGLNKPPTYWYSNLKDGIVGGSVSSSSNVAKTTWYIENGAKNPSSYLFNSLGKNICSRFYSDDFVFQTYTGWVIFCGTSQVAGSILQKPPGYTNIATPVKFNLSLSDNNSISKNGTWKVGYNTPSTITSVSSLNSVSASYPFDYNTINPVNGQKYVNGKTNNVYAYYLPTQTLSCDSSTYSNNKLSINYTITNSPGSYSLSITAAGTSYSVVTGTGGSGSLDLSNLSPGSYSWKLNLTYKNNKGISTTINSNNSCTFQVSAPSATISTSSTSSTTSAYPGTTVTLTNNINVSNVHGTGTDEYSFDITDTSQGGTLPGAGTASGTSKYADGIFPNSYTFTIPLNTTVSKYCRTISISKKASYAIVSNASTTACVNVTYPPVLTCSSSDYQETGFNGPIGYTITPKNSTTVIYGLNASINSSTSMTISPRGQISVTPNSAVNGTVSFGTPLPIGQYTLKINLTDNGNQVATVNCGLNIVLRPYFKVYGGGVMTGSNFMNSNGTCTNNNTPANIVAFNNGTNGSSTDQAIFSSGYVYGMGSQNNTTRLNNLTFANNLGLNGVLGGRFNGIQCMPDYYSQLKSLQGVSVDTASSTNINVFKKGVYIYNGGDVTILKNITFPTNTITSDGLPFMYIIVYGHNIYIKNSVTEVDAVLIAEPDNNGIGGHIYTCEDNVQANAFTSCSNTPLTIKGALLASQVHLLRTGSNNSTASSSVNATGGCETSFNGAEQICMSPLYWLTNPFSEITNTTTTTTDYIQQLPPTL